MYVSGQLGLDPEVRLLKFYHFILSVKMQDRQIPPRFKLTVKDVVA